VFRYLFISSNDEAKLKWLQGLKLELSTMDRVGVLRQVTRIFREHSLTVTRAEISSKEGKAISSFYVCDNNGDIVEQKRIEAIREQLGKSFLLVAGQIGQTNKSTRRSPIDFLFGGLFRAMSLNFGRPGS
jgi:ACT domain